MLRRGECVYGIGYLTNSFTSQYWALGYGSGTTANAEECGILGKFWCNVLSKTNPMALCLKFPIRIALCFYIKTCVLCACLSSLRLLTSHQKTNDRLRVVVRESPPQLPSFFVAEVFVSAPILLGRRHTRGWPHLPRLALFQVFQEAISLL